MATRRQWQLSILAAASFLLVSCGGSGDSDPVAKRVIVFGDSLSDIGAYTPATQIPLGQAPGVPPFFGGKFTTNTYTGYTAASNSSTALTWVEVIASRLGVAITPHEVGFGPVSVKCPVAASIPSLAPSCTGYAQGGSRVTSPAGIGNPNGNGINNGGPAPMTRPMVTQVADHLTRFTSFDAGDIVFVFGGNNDAFTQFGLVGAAAISPATAVANMQLAANQLATLVKEQILAKGATRVAVMNLPDASGTPGFSAYPAPSKALLTQLSAEFNTTLATALAGANVQMIDARSLNAAVLASPGSYGISNVTVPACDPTKMAPQTGGSSLFCNASPASAFTPPIPNLNSIRTGASASTWLFADGVHPTTGGHKVFADQVWTKLKDFGWVPFNL